jgi:hypothetical protein
VEGASERGDLERPALNVLLEEDRAAAAALAKRALERHREGRTGKSPDDQRSGDRGRGGHPLRDNRSALW